MVLQSSSLGHSRHQFLENFENLQNLNFFENPFNKDKSVGPKEITDTKKVLKFALNAELAKLKLTYITVVKKPKLGHSRHFAQSSLPSRSSGP